MNNTTECADFHNGEANTPPASILRLRPRVQDMRNGTFQPIVVYDDGGQGGAIFGDPVPTLKAAGDAACDACERALPAGDWQADGWLSAA
jgi:hypothetical protein